MSGYEKLGTAPLNASDSKGGGIWQLSPTDDGTNRSERWRHLPVPAIAGLNAPVGYLAPQATVDAVNVALALGQPLLITGEPGCGKSTLAGWIAARLGFDRLLRFQTRSTSVARELFYHFDAIGRFNAAQTRSEIDPRAYISYTALGEAILRARGRSEIVPLVDPTRLNQYPAQPVRSIVLIDEIDKAPRDFPNDLLGELESFYFEIPELAGVRIDVPPELLPIVVITSNAERALPDAFLRRCVYHHMSFPDSVTLEQIVYARLTDIQAPSALVKTAIELVTRLRSTNVRLQKPPGTSELLSFVLALRSRGYMPDARLSTTGEWISVALMTLIKTLEDRETARSMLTEASVRANVAA
jgi:MoxR-like ATPase